METITIKAPATFTTKVFDKPKGDPTRTATIMEHDLANWDQTALDALVVKGVQRLLNDLLSGVDAADKPTEFRKVLDKLNAGETWAEASGSKPRTASSVGHDPVAIRARTLIRRAVKAKLDPAEYKRDYTDASAMDQINRLDALLEKNPSFVDTARDELAREAKAAESVKL